VEAPESPPKTHFQEWVDRKLSIARGLNQSELGGSYYDAALIASAFIGCLASFAWPRSDEREQNDRKRFVEAWTNLSPPALGAHRVSIPLLIADLESDGRHEIAKKLPATQREAMAKRLRATHRAFSGWEDPRSVTSGDDVDLSTDKVKEATPDLSTQEIRRFSYGSVFYSDVRSALVHEYQITRGARAVALGRKEAGPSYWNVFVKGLLRPDFEEIRRTIHFPLPWLESLARGIAEKVEPHMERRLPRPEKWWLDGG
jgi:hypothetical protein